MNGIHDVSVAFRDLRLWSEKEEKGTEADFLFSFHGPSLYMGLEFRGHCLVESWGLNLGGTERGDHGSDSGTRSDSFSSSSFFHYIKEFVEHDGQ